MTKIYVHDHGYIELLEVMGTDDTIAESARVSYAGGTKKKRDNEKLIQYLMKHDHSSPFEMCVLRFRVKAPIFVSRQWVRHRTASINEVSGRYSDLSDEDFYLPEKLYKQDSKNRQKSDENEPINPTLTPFLKRSIEKHYANSMVSYRYLLSNGVSREIARIVIPLGLYTTFIWKCDLRNTFNFLRLRLGEGAQSEIRDYALAILSVVKDRYPIATQAFIEKYNIQQ